MITLVATACAKRIPEPVGARGQSPQVGWVIMSGDADNPDRDFVCQSNPRDDCVMPVDRPGGRLLSHLHVYYHAASTETKFTGTIQVGFFEESYEIKPSITVKPGESPGNQSVSGLVTMKPGRYTMSIAVVAAPAQADQTQNIRDQVSVIVR
jgi:hypothetical protein